MTRFSKHILLLVFLSTSFASLLNASIITVKQDGTGNFTTIQAGIVACSYNSGDTVLVWPGVYYENISFNGKHITVASLYITNPDKWYIHNTIIDGNHDGTTITMIGGSNTLTINGFTIRNGKGDGGGGVYINQAGVSIKNCNIEYNFSNAGGGIYAEHAVVYLSSTSIRYNHGKVTGGGINSGYNTQVNFDQANKCNIYCNFSAIGADYKKSYSSPSQTIVVDTFTVDNPDNFFIASYDIQNNPLNDIFVQMDHSYIEPAVHDLYVNPVSGNDSNSGISSDDPLRTIAFAYIKIKSDSLNTNNIFLSNGIYSPSTNDEKLPLGTRSYVSLIGESRDSTIIDADSLSRFFWGFGIKKNFSIENITFQHGKRGVYIEKNDFVTIKNVLMKDGFSGPNTGFNLYNCDSLYLKNVTIKNLKGHGALGIGNNGEMLKSFRIEDCTVINSGPDDDPINTGNEGGGMGINGDNDPPISYNGEVINTQITKNLRIPDPFWGPGMVVGFIASNYCKVNLINSTIGHNTLQGNYGFGTNVSWGAELNIYNSTLYGDSLRELSLGSPNETSIPATSRVYYSDIEGGQAEVQNWNNINTLVWGPGNINSDPLWDTTATIPYAIPWNSPCVNTGTPMYEFGMAPPFIIQEDTVYKLITFDYDTIVLPPTDLAGNPRIVGGRIDMGAYECQDTITGFTEFEVRNLEFEVTVYPNPFYANTFISFDLNKKTKVQAIIYDMKGNEVKKLMDATVPAGQYNLTWGGDDDWNEKVINGTYLISVITDGKIVASEKLVKQGK